MFKVRVVVEVNAQKNRQVSALQEFLLENPCKAYGDKRGTEKKVGEMKKDKPTPKRKVKINSDLSDKVWKARKKARKQARKSRGENEKF
jgi:hypothetical protein